MITVHPPNKKKAEAQDVIVSLRKAGVITAIQQSQLEMLFRIGNNCAHPQEIVNESDIERIITDGKQLASVIL